MVDGLVIAAGLSSRMGVNKLLLDLEGLPVIRRSVASIAPFCTKTIVVTGHLEEQVVSALSGVPGILLVHNRSYREGMFSSVKAGLAAVTSDRCVFLPGDIPLVCPSVTGRLLSCEADIIVPRHEGKAGHPVVFSRKAIDSILEGKGFETLRDFIRSRGAEYVDVDCEGILNDLDTEEDYRSAALYLASRRREGAC
ncbi:MAG TPA: NTP transferase domain-containing protein [Bacillota bacterium]|nr:NTP transferase domain-containing protein [Bacillota bacterium]HOA15521.1 NTP transferase domain-containing protein [Bacillota bacterium]